MKKTTLEFDDAKRSAVAAALGTTGLKATVDAAFDYVLRERAFGELVEAVRGGIFELENEEIEREGWRN